MDSELFSDIDPASCATSCPCLFGHFGGGGGEEGGDVLSNMILQKLTQEHGNEKIPSDSKEAN